MIWARLYSCKSAWRNATNRYLLAAAFVFASFSVPTSFAFDNVDFLSSCQGECRSVAQVCDTVGVVSVVDGERLFSPQESPLGVIDTGRLEQTGGFVTCMMRGSGLVALPGTSGDVLWADGWGVQMVSECVELLQIARNNGTTMAGGMFAGGERCPE